MVTYNAFEAIDKVYPPDKFAADNGRWTSRVHAILGDVKTGNEAKIAALETLIERVAKENQK